MRSLSLLFVFALISGSPAAGADDGLEFFEKKIRPVLVEKCYKCHSASTPKAKGGLRVDLKASLLEGGDSGAAVVPGKADESLLLRAISWSGTVSEMPPDGKLPEGVIADFRKWIAGGAAFPAGPSSPTSQPREVDIAEGRRFWAFQPVRVLPPPVIPETWWPQRKIDYFVRAALARSGMQPAPQADRRTLVRRLSMDLTGLPPRYSEVEEFAADASPDADARLVDRLLASPAYGERWARHWLDVARYAEDNPTSESTCKPPRFPYRYRDWVIRALNDDLPYDEFVRRQLAADLLDVPPEELAALGFLGLSPVYHKEPKLSAEVISVIVADEWDERLDAITRSFLGLTVACARCHDHKFDPIRTEDYYALAGVLASTQLVEWPLVQPSPESAASLTEVQRQIVDVELRFDYAKRQRDTAKGLGKDLASFDADVKNWEDTLKELKARTLFDGPIANGVRDAGLWINGEDPTWTLLDFRPGQSRDLPVFIRGNPANPGKSVPRRFLEVLSPAGARPFAAGSGRRELAEAMTRDAASLAARVIVNRVWGWHFDRPLVTTPSNFGRLGDPPSHPELLDDLAARFIESGWSLKWLHREIVLSATYQQRSSAGKPQTVSSSPQSLDSDNRLLGRMNRRRLEAEALRDTVLATTRKLDRAMFGPSIPLDEAKFARRTVYATVSRQKPADLYRLFDVPDAKRHSELRLPTTTPLQQLYLLNSSFLQQQSDAVAREVLAEGVSDPVAVVRELFRRILLREPTAEELEESFRLVLREDARIPPENWAVLAHSLFATNEFLFVD
ncbi:MAG: PSD1 domain-containing protein [Planctomycetaceae bacterium]|nr:PSD1 domain-containing protein [Planctomycetaceae bacterium]